MNGIGNQAAFYRGYLPDDRSLFPLTVLLSMTVALWLLVYLVAAMAEAHQDAASVRVASATFIRPPANLPILRDASPALLCDREQLGSRHAELTPQATRDAGAVAAAN
jgi:hypothetical protein